MRWVMIFWYYEYFEYFGILIIDLVSCCSNGHENEWECHWMQLFLYMETAVSLQLFIKHWLMLVFKYFMFMIRSFEMKLFWRFAHILGHFLTPIVVEYYIIYMFGFAEHFFDCVVVNTVHILSATLSARRECIVTWWKGWIWREHIGVANLELFCLLAKIIRL